MSSATRKASAHDSYMTLINQFPLRPIRTEAERDAAGAIMEKLALRDRLDRGESDYQDVLDDLIEAYDEMHHAMPAGLTPIQTLQSLMEANGLTARGLAKMMGVTEALVSLILAGKRNVSVAQAKRLGAHFKLELSAFL
jgi:HTH-type transcriptional regulator/antitoxin HigA